MSGGLIFLQPLALIALGALPLLYWLIRNLPPPARPVVFAPFALLPKEEGAPKSASAPWWIIVLRLLIAAVIIFAVALPQWGRPQVLTGEGPVTIVVQMGWTSAPVQDAMRAEALRIARQAGNENRLVRLMITEQGLTQAAPETSDRVVETINALRPGAFPDAPDEVLPDLEAIEGALYWISDGLALPGAVRSLLAARGATVINPHGGREAVLLGTPRPVPDGMIVSARRASGVGERSIALLFDDKEGQTLLQETLRFAPGETFAEKTLPLATRIRNEIAIVRIAGSPGVGGVQALDARWFTPRVAVISAGVGERSQPLLDPRHYLKAAFSARGELDEIAPGDAIGLGRDVWLVPGDVAMDAPLREHLAAAMEEGAVVVRFADEAMLRENLDDPLLPVALRDADRRLGGTLTWEDAQSIAPFTDGSPFAGISLPSDTRVRRQILADPVFAREDQIWARLDDGTPIVSAAKRAKGWLVFFHTSLDPQWTNLGQAPQMVHLAERLSALASPARASQSAMTQEVRYSLHQGLTNEGRLQAPIRNSLALSEVELGSIAISPSAPAGLWQAGARIRARNLADQETSLEPLGTPEGVEVVSAQSRSGVSLVPILAALAAALVVIDLMFQLIMGGGSSATRALMRMLQRRPFHFGVGALLAGLMLMALPQASDADDAEMLARVTNALTIGYVSDLVDPTRRITDRAGWESLSGLLFNRTSVEGLIAEPVRLGSDNISAFPMIYWSVPRSLAPLDPGVATKLRRFLENGGVLVLDTYDAGVPRHSAHPGLASIDAALGIPPLAEPDANHVIRRSFYLLDTFPGLWDDAPLYVDAEVIAERDGVSSVLITSADWTGAWATDENQMPFNLPVPGGIRQREMAIRVGINLVMYVLTGNYKSDQVHVPAFLERLGREAE
jgi:hypothetical protein